MKAGDIVATTGNRFIQTATVSQWSHVALAVNEYDVIEAIPNKVVIRPLSECITGSKSSYIFERPSELDEAEKHALIQHARNLEKQNLEYNKLRAGYSGLPHVLLNIFFLLGLINLLLAIIAYFTLSDISSSYRFLLFSLISIFLGLPLSRLSGMTKQVNECLERINAPEWLKNNVRDQFCSQLVEDIDRKISPSFSKAIKSKYEARPKDVVYACEKQGWIKRKI